MLERCTECKVVNGICYVNGEEVVKGRIYRLEVGDMFRALRRDDGKIRKIVKIRLTNR